jgi:nickel-type superoxide dismutase maturation protease
VWARLARRGRSRRVVVVDESMRPTLRPGDRLRVDPAAYARRPPQVGEVVVVQDPEDRVKWLVKRIAAVDAATGAVEVQGDAPSGTRDSRRFGPVSAGAIVGRVYRIYYPVDRAREL